MANNEQNNGVRRNNIALLLMIRNESKIIERCLGEALNYVDAVSILDTGSNDNTVEIADQFLKNSGKPYKITVEPWKNFGYNRTVSFQRCQEFCKELDWDLDISYAFAVDADMVIKPSEGFRNYFMKQNGYLIIQKNPSIQYYNVRFMKLSHNWKCVGATHEYWSGDPTDKLPFELIYIDDKNDGGCKSDKFERDICLLEEELTVEPDNPRTHFYLAQSYKDSGKFKKAIKLYKRRIEIGGWHEEVWYSYYMIAMCYYHMNEPEKMEMWINKGYKYYNNRSENLYFLTKYFREKSQHHKAYHYYLLGRSIPYPKDDSLFIDKSVYDGLFEYENTILACYVNKKTRTDSLNEVVNYLNRDIAHHIDNVWDNIIYYVDPLMGDKYKGEYSKYLFPDVNEYQASSCSLAHYDNKWVMNVRYVNYDITPTGAYHMRSPDGMVKTKNGKVYLNESLQPISTVTMMNEQLPKKYPSHIQGLEDIRIFEHNSRLYSSCTTKEIVESGKLRIALGNYDINRNMINGLNVIEPPTDSDCEKNWVYLPTRGEKMNFIYGWHPYQIGEVDSGKLTIHTVRKTPRFFNRFRGSSNICEYNGKLWCIVHLVRYSTPRIYLHSLVQLNRETYMPERYSLPFCFRDTKIEYCLGMTISNGTMRVVFSENDSSPGLISVPIDNLVFCQV